MAETLKPKSGWRIVRRILVALAVLVTLIAIFYTEEDWRGKRAWENCKQELEAQGVVLDWDKFMPPSVPDDQNFFMARTNIFLRFKQHSADDPDYKAALANPWLRLQITPSNSYPIMASSGFGPVVAKLIITPRAPAGLEQDTNTLVVNLDDPAAVERARNLIQAVIGPSIPGATGLRFYLDNLNSIHPAQIYVPAAIPPADPILEQMIPSDARLMLGVAVAQTNFEVRLFGTSQVVLAAGYLKWSDQYVPAFADIREALKRPYAILPGDYSQPYQSPIPNFITMRALAQTLAQRAQCYLLLGEPDKALHEVTLIHEVCRVLEKPPAGQPEFLVEAMINVAIHGLYQATIAGGLQQHEWQEPQLAALQEQLAQVNLPPLVIRAFESEPAATCRDLQTEGLGVLFDAYHRADAAYRWGNLENVALHSVADFGPRGWVYQNMAAIATVATPQSRVFDPASNTVQPEKLKDIEREMHTIVRPFMFHLFVEQFVPNFTRTWQTTAYNQTLINEAQIACALERYHLAHGEYPETLDALSPQYMQTIPHDIIGGQPLHYRRTDDGKFLLYSIGWNEVDDGGQELPQGAHGYVKDYAQGDWVWPN